MLYRILKIFSRLFIHIFCRNIRINNAALLQTEGPVLLATNHPNSFLDAIILDTLFEQPIYALARGDAFKNKRADAILRSLNMLPVYREREGTENLQLNYNTFDDCINIFKKDGIVLIFSEALCENEWHLRPLKKGTARLAVATWQKGIPVKILPVGINYNSFYLFGKNVQINFGNFIDQHDPAFTINESGKLLNDINIVIQQQLQQLVYEIPLGDKEQQARIFTVPISRLKKILLTLPAVIGYLLHFPLYYPANKIIKPKTLNTGHYDSILNGLLLLTYPFYLLLLSLIAFWVWGGFWWLGVFLLVPFTAWSCVQLMQQTDD